MEYGDLRCPPYKPLKKSASVCECLRVSAVYGAGHQGRGDAVEDSKQNWYHSLACLRTTLEVVKEHWTDVDSVGLQSDGAGNYSCTAFMTSLPRVGEVAKVRITYHIITEVCLRFSFRRAPPPLAHY